MTVHTIRFSEALEMIGNDKEMMRQIFEVAKTDLNNLANSLRKHHNYTEQLQLDLHTLKGLARTLGATDFGDEVAIIEQQVKTSESISEEELKQLLNSTNAMIQQWDNFLNET